MAAVGSGGDLKWQGLINRLPVVVSILENPSTERKVAAASVENLKRLHDQAQALVQGHVVVPSTLDEGKRKEIDDLLAGITRCLDKFPLHILLEASQPKRLSTLIEVPPFPKTALPPGRAASLPNPPATMSEVFVSPPSKSEGFEGRSSLGVSPPRGKPLTWGGVDSAGWRPSEKVLPKHSDTGTTGVTTELPSQDRVQLFEPPMAGKFARGQGAFGGLGVASKPESDPPREERPRVKSPEADIGFPVRVSGQRRAVGLSLADPGEGQPKSGLTPEAGLAREGFWENGWTTVVSRDIRTEIATAELDLLRENDERRAARLRLEREAEQAGKAARAREARQLYAGLEGGIRRVVEKEEPGSGVQEMELSARKESESGASVSSGAEADVEADVESQQLPGGFSDIDDRAGAVVRRLRAVKDSRHGHRIVGEGGTHLSGPLRNCHDRTFETERPGSGRGEKGFERSVGGAKLDLRIAVGDPDNPEWVPLNPGTIRKDPLGLSLWCSPGEKGDQIEREDSPQSPLGDRRKSNGWGSQPRRSDGSQAEGMSLQAERSTPSPPVSLGLTLHGARQRNSSPVDTCQVSGSVGQPSSVGLGRLELGSSRETSESDRGLKRSKAWPGELLEDTRQWVGAKPRVVAPAQEEVVRRPGVAATAREHTKRPRVGQLSPPPLAKPPQKPRREFDYSSSLRASVDAFLAHTPSPSLPPQRGAEPPGVAAPLGDRNAKPGRFTQPIPPKTEPPPARKRHSSPISPSPEYPHIPAPILTRAIPEIALQGLVPFPQHFGGVSGPPKQTPPYPKLPLDPSVYPFGAVPMVPPMPYGALPDWSGPYPPHMFNPAFDPNAHLVNAGLAEIGAKGLPQQWADGFARWQGGIPEQGRTLAQTWPHSAPTVAAGPLQGVHSRPHTAPVPYLHARNEPPTARGFYGSQEDAFPAAKRQSPPLFPPRGFTPGHAPHFRTQGDISSVMPSLDLNQPPVEVADRKPTLHAGLYGEASIPKPTRGGHPGFLVPPVPFPGKPALYPVEVPASEGSYSPPPYAKARAPPVAFSMPAFHPLVSYPPGRPVPDSPLFSNILDPPGMNQNPFVVPVAYGPESLVPPPAKLPYPPVAPIAYDPGQIAYEAGRHPVPVHLQTAYPVPNARALNLLNPSDPGSLGFFPASWAAEARGHLPGTAQHPVDPKELPWGSPPSPFRRGRPGRQYVPALQEPTAVQEKVRGVQMFPPQLFFPVPIPEARRVWQGPETGAPPPTHPSHAFAAYPTWDLRGSQVLPFGRLAGLACDSSVASNGFRRTDSDEMLPALGDEARVPLRNESLEEIAYVQRLDGGSPVGLGVVPVRSARGAGPVGRLGEDFIGPHERNPSYMAERYMRGVEEGERIAHWQRSAPVSPEMAGSGFKEGPVHRALPTVCEIGPAKRVICKEVTAGHEEKREGKKRGSDEATSKSSAGTETDQPSKKRSSYTRAAL